jgi:hypothetical protein
MKSRYPSKVNRDGMISKFPKISADGRTDIKINQATGTIQIAMTSQKTTPDHGSERFFFCGEKAPLTSVFDLLI